MRRERLTYRDLLRRLLSGRLLRTEERRQTELILGIPEDLEVAVRLGDLLEQIASRGTLLRLGRRSGDRRNVRRYLDPLTSDHWTVELPDPGVAEPPVPGPSPDAVRPPPGPSPKPEAVREPAPAPETAPETAPAPTPVPEPAAEPESAAEPTPIPGPAPVSEPRPPVPAHPIRPVEEVVIEPGIARRFHDETSGEPLHSLFSTFSPCLTPEELGESLVPVRNQIRERTSASDVRFYTLDAEGESLLLLPQRDQAKRDPLTLGEQVRQAVLIEGRNLHVPNLAVPDTGAPPGETGALVSLPLVDRDRVVGLMEVHRDRPGPFDAEELRFFALSAAVAASVVVQAEVLEKLIFLDKLTGLYNRAYFDDQIEREIERANRMGTSVALLMADLDHFKRINDTYGHQAGDQALAHLAVIIRQNIRQIDVAARYGGEEFAILLPSITRARAVRTAERLRRVVADTKFEGAVPGLNDVRLSISLGVALYPDDAATAKQLIDRADRVALYAAKNRGRNRVVSWASAREMKMPLKPPPASQPNAAGSTD
jgi:diguanylate cyclase (GGDEF)-like protein